MLVLDVQQYGMTQPEQVWGMTRPEQVWGMTAAAWMALIRHAGMSHPWRAL